MVLVGNLRQIVHFCLGDEHARAPLPERSGVDISRRTERVLAVWFGHIIQCKVFLVPVGHPILKHVVGLCGSKIVV